MARREHRAREYADLLERYLKELPLGAAREDDGRRCRFSLELDYYGSLPCGRAMLLVGSTGELMFEYKVQIPFLKERRCELLEELNACNRCGHGGLSFYLEEEKAFFRTVWRFGAAGRLMMDACNCASARKQAQEVFQRMGHLRSVMSDLGRKMPDLFGAETLTALAEEEFRDSDLLEEDDWEDPEEEFDCSGESADETAAPDFEVCGDEDALIERYEREGADSLSGYDLIRVHLALRNRLERKKAELAAVQAALHEADAMDDEEGERLRKSVSDLLDED